MRNKIFIGIAFFFLCMCFVLINPIHKSAYAAPAPAPTVDPSIQDGDWLPDSDVTFQGKTASRSALLMNLVLTNYQWVNNGVNGDAPLILFWTKIRNIIYGILLLVLLAAAFAIIISGGKSLTAWMFMRRFIIMVIIIWFSFALCRFLYEVVDIVIGFFNKNPEGLIITSKDLFNMSFNYQDFVGLRRFGPSYNESAFVSLLLVRLTAITYYVMAGILLVRKIILWFFIAVSPIYPLLLFHFPIRNTAKIWIGEFFRWLLYAPLFFIFLSSLVVIWRNNINLFPFDFGTMPIVYPTAINILLGGPGQQLDIKNSVNYNDTFAQYIIALIMLWIVIFLPFILLRIFLDYLWSLNLDKGNTLGYIQNFVKRVPGNQFFFPNTPVAPVPIPPSPPPGARPTGMAKKLLIGTQPTGMARELPRGEKLERYVEKTREIERPVLRTIQQATNVQVQIPAFKSEKTSTETMKLASIAIPRMRDIARYESNKTSSQVASRQEISRMHTTLQKIANPASIPNTVERQQYTQLRDKLVQQSQKGEPLATSILSAANTVNKSNQRTSVTQQQVISNVQQTLQKISNPESITNITEKQQYTSFKNQLLQASKQGDSYATTMMHTATNISNLSKTDTHQASVQVQQTLEKIATPETIADTAERQKFTALRQQLVEESKKGDTVATSILSASTSLIKANDIVVPQALPQVNQVQTVNLEDYEEVKKTWLENYKKMEVPKSADATERSRKQWIQSDQTKLTSTIDLLTSKDQQKVDEGMKEVSSLLPFLLIGGFSQAEVVSYLQAKKHAADEAIMTIKESENEEDTLVSATKQTTQAVKHLTTTVSASANDEDDIESDSPLSNVVSRYTERMSTLKSSPQLKSGQSSMSTMKLVNFSVPTMQDVARFESAKILKQEKVRQEISQVNQMLQNLSNPEALSNAEEKQQYITMKQQLIEAGQKGDPLANSIIFAVNSLSQASTLTQSTQQYTQAMSHLYQTFQDLEDPLHITDASVKEQFTVLSSQLNQASAGGDVYAKTILNFTKDITQKDTQHGQEYMQHVLQYIANPRAIVDANEKQQFSAFKEMIVQHQQQGDPIAIAIITAANMMNINQQVASMAMSQQYQQQWQQVAAQAVQALQKLDTPQIITSDPEKQQVVGLKAALEKDSSNGDDYAVTVLAMAGAISQGIQQSNPDPISQITPILDKIADPNSAASESEKTKFAMMRERLEQNKQKETLIALPLANAVESIFRLHQMRTSLLPQVNQVQTVNLDDYEEIRRMWHDIYKNSDVPMTPENPNLTRKEWIQDDMNKLTETIGLLKSDDPAENTKGMNEVGSLLPFLLIGGFSQNEVIAYLQAKKQAGEDVVRELSENENDEEAKVSSEVKSTDENIQYMQTEATVETNQNVEKNDDQNSTLS